MGKVIVRATRFGIDIDGVLADWNSWFYATLVKVSGRELGPCPNPSYWDWPTRQLGYTDQEAGEAYQIMWNDPLWWEDVPPYPSTSAALLWLSDRNMDGQVYFITHRHGVNVKFQTENWLEQWGYDRPTVIVVKEPEHKAQAAQALSLTYMLEDSGRNAKNVKSASPETQVFLLDCNHNRPMQPELTALGVNVIATVGEFKEAVTSNGC